MKFCFLGAMTTVDSMSTPELQYNPARSFQRYYTANVAGCSALASPPILQYKAPS